MHTTLNYLAAMAACTLFATSASAQSAVTRAQVYANFSSPQACRRITSTLRPPLSSPRQEPSKL